MINPVLMPIVVGVPRSGTTLLRLMLDAHPDLAIPAETGFAFLLAPMAGQTLSPELAADLITGGHTWADMGLSTEDLLREFRGAPELDPTEALRSFYRLYARRHGKWRYGDKTPIYGQHLFAIEALLPEACFIHIIRDGRDVAVSWRATWFAPGSDTETLAVSWKEQIITTRDQARSCRRYLEVRYEDLVQNPRETLETVCRVIELPFDETMLNYHRRSHERLSEFSDRVRPDGTLIATRARRLDNHRLTSDAPQCNRIGRWQEEFTGADVEAFEASAGDLLAELGYTRTTGG